MTNKPKENRNALAAEQMVLGNAYRPKRDPKDVPLCFGLAQEPECSRQYQAQL